MIPRGVCMATIELTKDNIDQTIEDNDIVLIDFTAPWMEPCKAFSAIFEAASERYPDAVFISAKTGEGLAGLEERVNKTLLGKTLRVEVRVPATDGKTIAKIRRLLGDPTDSIEDDHYVVEGTIESKTTGELERISGVSVRYLL